LNRRGAEKEIREKNHAKPSTDDKARHLSRVWLE
jgi:hypothetical protein